MGEGLELSFNSSMYSFEDPASLIDHSISLFINFCLKVSCSIKEIWVTPQYRIGTVESHHLADEQLSTSLQEVRSELREAKETVGRMVQETKASSNKEDMEKMKVSLFIDGEYSFN